MEAKGKIGSKVLKKGKFVDQHFNPRNYQFIFDQSLGVEKSSSLNNFMVDSGLQGLGVKEINVP